MYFRVLTALAGMLVCANIAAAFPFAYITNFSDNTVSIVDTKTNEYKAKVSLGTGQKPFGVAIKADGKRVYISNQTSKSISVIDALTDTANPTVINTISGLPNTPSGIAINPAGTRLYVANSDAMSVTVLDVSALTPNTTVSAPTITVASPTVGTAPAGIAVHPSGSHVYVANSGSNSVSVIETTNNTVEGSPITVGSNPMGIAVGTVSTAVKIFVANYDSNSVSIIDATTRAVTPVSNVGSNPYAVAVSPDGTKVFVSNSSTDRVSVIATSNNSVTTPYQLAANSGPMSLAVTPDGTKLYTVNNIGGPNNPGGAQGAGSLSSIKVLDNPVNAYTISNLTNALGNPNPNFAFFFNSPLSLGNFIGPQLYTVTATAGTNGTVASADGQVTSAANGNMIKQVVSSGATPVYTITPESLYRVNNISINGNIINLKTDSRYAKGTTSSTFTFGAINSDPAIDVTFIKDFDYVSITRPADYVTANGSITSEPASIQCSASASPSLCNRLFQEGTRVKLIATPNQNKYFNKWVGDRDGSNNLINNGAVCDGKMDVDAQGRGICEFDMTTYTHITATFSDTPVVDWVKMIPQNIYYPTITNAFSALTAATTEVRLTYRDYVESPNLDNLNANFKLSGGWDIDKSFNIQGAPSTITGTFTITKGTVTIDNIVIK